jgi:hypothetical protein
MNLAGTQIKDTYGNLITIGTVAGTPTTGTLQNGAGSDLTSITLNGGAVFNEGGGDFDFRVEGDTITNLLFVDASTDRVGIGTIPTGLFHVSGGTAPDTRGILVGFNNLSQNYYTANSHFFRGGNSESILNITTSTIVANENGADIDFRIEGDTDANLFRADAGNDRVGIGTGTPTAKLNVEGSAIFNDAGADVDFRVEGDTNTHLIFADASVDKVMIGSSSSGTGGRLEVVGGSIGISGIYGNGACKTIVGQFTTQPNTTATVTIDLGLANLVGGFQCHVGSYISGAAGDGQLFFTGGGRYGTSTAHNDIHVIRNSTPDGDLTFGTPVHSGANNTITFTIVHGGASGTTNSNIYLTVFGNGFTADPTITIS